ncbi:hypothetical protein BKN38_01400 [Helicobacter sp. CLO-3]|uniref:DUF502 domain-containing protein n=1 Tax=unclassified Helicobacter TaxID=2593540 RepID=UPI0008059CDE|nr:MULTISPECIES: DUF502 domain-containing protein [unclassified Helicobacter]OBV29766.1 hypothetical protein BA723_00205 [Helicobacter sp. CLO-3]OHU85219.1 hypothetical protein BKN38_01400 [Helicobacter sp. CLO-3]
MSSLLRLVGKGILALSPIIILIWILKFAYDILARIIGVIFNTTANNLFATLAILLILLLILAYAGHLLETKKDFILLKISEFFINKIPVVDSLYNVIKDMVKMFSGSSDTQYLGVGYLQLGEHKVVGFITKEEDEHLWVFVPTTPNPTSGFLFRVEKEKIERTDISVADGLKKVVSLGIK